MSWNAETNIKGPKGDPGGVPEAPTDGQTYGRKNAAWSPVTGGGGGITDAPSDSKYYTRYNATWVDGDTIFATDAALAAALTTYAPLASPTFTGDPKAPTPATADNDTSIATTAFVKAQNYATSASVPIPATVTPLVESGAGAVGTATKYAREDHVHPAGGGGGSSVYAADTPPAGAPDNSLWVETDTGMMFFRYNDGNSTQWVSVPLAVPYGGVRYDTAQTLTSTQKQQARDNIAATLRGFLFGLTLSTAGSSATFSVAAGEAADSSYADKMRLASAYTKTTAAWAVGSGLGSLDTGAIANTTWYHVHLIKRPDTGVVDVLVSLSATAPTLPANYTLFRRIGAMKTNASAQWVKFIQDGDRFTLDVPVNDVPIVTNPGTAAVTRTLASVPTGIRVNARIAGVIQSGAAGAPGALLVSDLAVADTAASVTACSIYFYNPGATTVVFGAMVEVMTNTSGQIRTRIETSGAAVFLYINTIGWVDTRGKDA